MVKAQPPPPTDLEPPSHLGLPFSVSIHPLCPAGVAGLATPPSDRSSASRRPCPFPRLFSLPRWPAKGTPIPLVAYSTLLLEAEHRERSLPWEEAEQIVPTGEGTRDGRAREIFLIADTESPPRAIHSCPFTGPSCPRGGCSSCPLSSPPAAV